MPGALLIYEGLNIRELTLDGKRGPVLFDLLASSREARARPGGDDFLLGEDDTCCLELHLARPGGKPVLVSRGTAFGAAWMPNGRGFAYTRALGPGTELCEHPEVLVWRRRGRDRTSEDMLTRARAGIQEHEPTWSPEGRRVAFTRLKDCVDGVLYLLDVTTGIQRRITRGESADWSPTQDVLAYELVGEIWTIDLSTGRRRRLTASSVNARNPLWSPNGQQIAFERIREDKDGLPFTEIRVVSATGGKPRLVSAADVDLLDWPRPRRR